jgi:hypothetical protein
MFSAAEPLHGVGGTTACVAVGGPNLGSELGIMTISLTHRGTTDLTASADGGPADYSVTTIPIIPRVCLVRPYIHGRWMLTAPANVTRRSRITKEDEHWGGRWGKVRDASASTMMRGNDT